MADGEQLPHSGEVVVWHTDAGQTTNPDHPGLPARPDDGDPVFRDEYIESILNVVEPDGTITAYRERWKPTLTKGQVRAANQRSIERGLEPMLSEDISWKNNEFAPVQGMPPLERAGLIHFYLD